MPEQQLVEVFILQDSKYKRITTYVKEDKVPSHTLPGLEFNLMELFE